MGEAVHTVETSGRLGSSSELSTLPLDMMYKRLSESGILPGKYWEYECFQKMLLKYFGNLGVTSITSFKCF